MHYYGASAQKVDRMVAKMNEVIPKHTDSSEWKYDSVRSIHFVNTQSVDMLIEKLFHIFTEENPH